MAAERNQTQADVSTSSQVLTARAPHAPDTPVVDTIYAPAESIELVELPYKQNASTAAAPVEEGTSPASVSEDAVREQHRKVNIHFCTMCFSMFLLGWNDGSTGPLLPRIQEVYHVNFTIVSLLFIFNCFGFIIGAFGNLALTERFGFGWVMALGSAAQLTGYALAASAPPFPVFILGYFINGFGMSLQDAAASGYIISFNGSTETKMGILQAVYGLGAFCSPLVATQFAEKPHWSFHYLVSLGIALLNTILVCSVLRFRTLEQCLADLGYTHAEAEGEGGKYKQIFRLRSVHFLAFFIFVYVGIEVTVGGWIVTYVIDVRNGGPSAGYISSGFFGGLMLGRVLLLWVNKKIGERYVVFIYVALTIGLEIVVWLVPSLIGGAVAVSLVGLFLGPIYPIVMNHSGRILPPWLLTGCIGWITGFGTAGSAFWPFMTGLMANNHGIKTLQPLLVSMMCFLLCVWAIVPNHPRRIE